MWLDSDACILITNQSVAFNHKGKKDTTPVDGREEENLLHIYILFGAFKKSLFVGGCFAPCNFLIEMVHIQQRAHPLSLHYYSALDWQGIQPICIYALSFFFFFLLLECSLSK